MKFFVMTAMSIAVSLVSIAQSVQIEGVEGGRFNGVNPIISTEGETVSGYYTYYMLEKEDKGMRTFEFAIIDKAVTKVVKAPITLHKWANINTTVFNDKYFLISYDDAKNKQVVINVLDLDGKITKTKTISTEKKRLASSTAYPAAGGTGFYIVRPIEDKKANKFGFSIEFLNNELEEQWKVEEVVAKGVSRVADLVNTPDRFVVWKEHGQGLNKLKPEIVCYDAKTGKKIFQYDGYDGTSTILYNQLRIDKDGGILAGGAYVEGEKYRSANNDGVYVLKLTPEGKKVLYTKVNNSEQIQTALKATSKGFTVGSKDKIYVEDLILDDAGNIIVVSEMFRKNFNPKPAAYQTPRDLITGKFIGDIGYRDNNGKQPKVTFEVMDYMLFMFNQKGALSDIKPISKEEYNKITVYEPYQAMWGMDMAKAVDRLGWFDYGFTTTDENGKRLMVCANNAEARKPQVVTYALDENHARTKINLKNDGNINADDAKVGYFKAMRQESTNIAVAYYQRKLQRITINIESIK